MSNRLEKETSPYLLQHKENPVDWYPWCDEAFEKAKNEDKPIFLSIGYSTCHWCHVMAHECFEDGDIADILNRHFISIKVDKEERPDIDSIYMTVCQAFTGSAGWPNSIFMTPEQKPFFAGTYFPKSSRGGMMGFEELLLLIHDRWQNNKGQLLLGADDIISHLQATGSGESHADKRIILSAVSYFKQSFDRKHGGFGRAPKFPTPHNIIFLLSQYEKTGERECLEMAEMTLLQMYKGGLFDHIGYGFCRYSTDAKFLVPHFEKMLYDNALLTLAYCKAYEVTKNRTYLEIAEKTGKYILCEMTSENGGFYSAQDADSDGEEGKYYVFVPDEILKLLGQRDGEKFCKHFDITKNGNFEGKSIPNLLNTETNYKSMDMLLPQVLKYRKERTSLHTDDKVLTAWNCLMISAMCELYRKSGKEKYLTAAKKADRFISDHVNVDGTLFVSYRDGKLGVKGFLDDYASHCFAQLSLHEATLDSLYLERAKHICDIVFERFADFENGGFFLYANDSESLILRPKETYDGAIPSGNSLMAYNLTRLYHITGDMVYEKKAARLIDFISANAALYPMSHSMFLTAYSMYLSPPTKVTIVSDGSTKKAEITRKIPSSAVIEFMYEPTKNYPLKNKKTTFYVCKGRRCLPPANDLGELIK